MWLIPNYCMPQLQISSETMSRMKEIVGINQVHDGDFMVNEIINILEKKIKENNSDSAGMSSQRCDYNHTQDPKCQTCGAKIEDLQHFFLTCPTYNGPRPAFLHVTCDFLDDNNIQIDFRKLQFRGPFLNLILNDSPVLD